MRISQMDNKQLVDAYAIASAQEATWVPGPNGRGRKKYESILKRAQLLEKEILQRMESNR